jgi:hypothetical protein
MVAAGKTAMCQTNIVAADPIRRRHVADMLAADKTTNISDMLAADKTDNVSDMMAADRTAMYCRGEMGGCSASVWSKGTLANTCEHLRRREIQ